MPQSIAEIMTRAPSTVDLSDSATQTARVMRDDDIGDVLVVRPGGTVFGIVTDRDLALRVVAEGLDPSTVQVEDICSRQVIGVSSRDSIDQAAEKMREHAVRRLPVIDDDQLVGVVSLGDLAIERNPESALADISEAPPNN